MARRWFRWAVRVLAAAMGAGLLFAGAVVADGWAAFGASPKGERRGRMEASSQWAGSRFENPQPLWNDPVGMFTEGLEASAYGSPSEPLPVQTVPPTRFETPPPSGLRVTWLGHSTLLLEIDGRRFLTDPVWGERTSPVSWLGPKRWYAPPLALPDLPELDAVLISHDHYDHLDHPTIVALAGADTRFVAPLGVGAHLERWGVPADRIDEVDWWDALTFGEVTVTAVPARHASGRHVLDQNRTLWAGYALTGDVHRALYSGDTGIFPGMRDIGRRLGPFDVTMVEVGAYAQSWPDWHLGPEQAVRAHQMLRGKLLLPVHWGLFNLAYHGWTEPIERTAAAAELAGVALALPRPGESVEPEHAPPSRPWWPQLPWRTAQTYPLKPTGMD